MDVEQMGVEYAIELGWARTMVAVQYHLLCKDGDTVGAGSALDLFEELMDREVLA